MIYMMPFLCESCALSHTGQIHAVNITGIFCSCHMLCAVQPVTIAGMFVAVMHCVLYSRLSYMCIICMACLVTIDVTCCVADLIRAH